jgi:hypothetical protein
MTPRRRWDESNGEARFWIDRLRAVKNPTAIRGAGHRAQVGRPPTPGDVCVPTSAVAGVLAGGTFVQVLVEDANPDGPS